MDKVAIITAAGYKGVGIPFDLQDCPESLLPLGNGETILSRLCRQLEGYEIFITVGAPGSTYSRVTKWNAKIGGFDYVDVGGSPWNDERIEYVRQLGTPIIVDNPDWKTQQDSICHAFDRIGFGYDKYVLTAGDHLYSDRLIGEILNADYPRQYSVREYLGNRIFILNQEAARLYRKFASYTRDRGMRAWFGNKHHMYGDIFLAGNQESTGRIMANLCPLMLVSGDEFPMDVDTPGSYEKAIRWIKRFA